MNAPSSVPIGDVDLEQFWSKVLRAGPNECWHWAGPFRSLHSSYGAFHINRRVYAAHRVAAALSGASVDGALVRHDCDNPKCVNPSHLQTGTHTDNVRDMWERGRQGGTTAANAVKTHCPQGHPLSGSNLNVRRGQRECKECHRQRASNYYERKRASLGMQVSRRPR